MVRRVLGILVAAAAVVLLVLWPREEQVDRAARAHAPTPGVEKVTSGVRSPAVPKPGAIVVEVVDGADGTPLGADLVLRPERGAILDGALVERDGKWEAAGLAPGSYLVSVGTLQFVPTTVVVEVPAGTRVPVRVELLANPALHGYVNDEAGTPLAGIMVAFGWVEGDELRATYTAANGAFHIGLPPHEGPECAGELVVQDPRDIYSEVRRRIDNPSGFLHCVTMERAACVTGRLVPRPDADVRYHLTFYEGATTGMLEVAPDGSFVLGDVPIGQVIYLTLVPAGKAPIVRGPFRLEKGEQKDLGDLPVGRGRSLSFAVRSANGAPVRDLSVVVLLPGVFGQGFKEPRIVGFASDVAHLDLLPDGPVLLCVAAHGLAPRWIRVDDVAAFARNEIVLEPAGVLEVTVVDADGAPVGGAVVVRNDEWPTFEQDVSVVHDVKLPPTDERGRVLVDLAPGHYYLQLDGARSRPAEIRGGETTRVELRLQRPPR
jgi:hypothetical protein